MSVPVFAAYALSAAFSCSGLAYFMSIALSPLKAQLYSVIYVLVALMFSGLATPLRSLTGNSLFWALTYASVRFKFTKIEDSYNGTPE